MAAPSNIFDTSGSASFASKSKRSDFTKAQIDIGDPGAYDPSTHTTLGATAKKSVSKSKAALRILQLTGESYWNGQTIIVYAYPGSHLEELTDEIIVLHICFLASHCAPYLFSV